MAEEKKVKLKKTSQKWKAYEVVGGELKRKNSSCPKCGAGVFLAKHKNRQTCGKCGYAEFGSKKE